MIGALNGSLMGRKGDLLTLDVGGVGYELTVTNSVLESLPVGTDVTAKVRLVVFTDVKENAITLYGFRDSLEKEVFLLLKKVKGIGSRIALSIVSAVGPEALLQAIGRNDVTRLKSIPGVGTKTAERVIVELRETVNDFARESAGAAFTTPADRSRAAHQGAEGDVLLALEKLGFPLDRARKVIDQTLRVHEKQADILRRDSGELLRLALGQLG